MSGTLCGLLAVMLMNSEIRRLCLCALTMMKHEIFLQSDVRVCRIRYLHRANDLPINKGGSN